MQNQLYVLWVKWIIKNDAGKILLLKADRSHKPGRAIPIYWDLPGWRQDVWEKDEETLKREIQEETWLIDISIWQHLWYLKMPWHVKYDNWSTFRYILSFYIVNVVWEPEIILSDEHVLYEWVSKEIFIERTKEKYTDRLEASIRNSL